MDEYIKEALELVKVQAKVRNMSKDEMNSMLQYIANRIKSLDQGEDQESQAKEQVPPVDPKKAIKEKSIVCLECGGKFKILTKKHLAKHGLTPAEYREKWGYKKNTALVARSLSKQRKKQMEEMAIWKKRQRIDKITDAVMEDFDKNNKEEE